MKYTSYIITISAGIFLLSCRQSAVEPVKKEKDTRQQEQFIAINRYLLERDMILIDNYAKRNNLKLTRTQSGLSYQIIQRGHGKKIESSDKVVFAYKLSLLDGTLCYSSDSTGIKETLVGTGQIERGLDEGICLLKEGDSAVFILPPHLAYGVIGDGKCIPPRSCIVYHIRIISAFRKLHQ
ncbi:MAG: FKBP-type peptidyl-prolyl cis-trans isomerase [Bacteroidales bacterium]|nr:FKBP-type peptidyl-prolyl cis-trans isomerase [Bacteroidales bacterium]